MNDTVKQGFAKDGVAGGAVQPCAPTAKRNLSVTWSVEEVYCADAAALDGAAAGIASEVQATAHIVAKGRTVDSGTAKGQSSFKVNWKADKVNFEKAGAKMPDRLPLVGKLSADGMEATTPKALAARRLPDQAASAVTMACSSPKSVNGTADYAWTAAFKLGVENASIKVQQTLQIKKAWLGKWVLFDAKKDKLAQTFGFVKKSGTAWKYWDTAKTQWKALPRDVSAYSLTAMVFVQSGKNFVSRDDGGKFSWPEAFAQPKSYDAMKAKWLKNIHQTWDKAFRVKHKDCTGTGMCEWVVDVHVDWSAAAGDKLVHAVWSPEWERSNASDWYLSEDRLGVAGHECGHLLGAYDEYTGGAIHPSSKKIEDDSIMGQNLTTAKPRHFDGFRDELKKRINTWIGRDWPLEVKAR